MRVCQTLHVSYDDAGIERIVQRLRSIEPKVVVLEATGGLETRFLDGSVQGLRSAAKSQN